MENAQHLREQKMILPQLKKSIQNQTAAILAHHSCCICLNSCWSKMYFVEKYNDRYRMLQVHCQQGQISQNEKNCLICSIHRPLKVEGRGAMRLIELCYFKREEIEYFAGYSTYEMALESETNPFVYKQRTFA